MSKIESLHQQYNATGRNNQHLKMLQQDYLENGVDILSIGQTKFLFQEDPILLYKIIDIMDKEYQLRQLQDNLPTEFNQMIINKLLEQEIFQTNNIEGVKTNRNSIRNLLYDFSSKRQHVERQVVSHYQKVLLKEVNPQTSEDISKLYRDFLQDYMSEDDLQYMGDLFRLDTVHVLKPGGKVIHTGIQGEQNIVNAVDTILDYWHSGLHNEYLRIAIFHYLLGYIHPFYDGNGRMARLLTCAQLYPKISIASLALSNVIYENQSNYYQMFEETNSHFNVGDLTSFIYQFLLLIEEAISDTILQVHEYVEKRAKFKKLIASADLTNNQIKCLDIIYNSSLLNEEYNTKQLSVYSGLSIPTVLTVTKGLIDKGYVQSIESGKYTHYRIQT